YIKHPKDENFLKQLPYIIIPSSSKSELLAMEIANSENLPAGYDYHAGDILIFEIVNKENIHRILNRLGLRISPGELHLGVFSQVNNQITLSLNEYVQYSFDIESEFEYWVLKGVYIQAF
ncbi:MAG: hypothetical protein LIO93_12125, partial [Bacteroidales bacterium]|nr:hypothetical protein [Bacteroidales bacterium]